ncbi:MAG: DUF2334 domain-containing protein [Dehalococcoidia bacterium]|nr:DUF2334 domain-containing protein [Dehalococcoidia bacterium]
MSRNRPIDPRSGQPYCHLPADGLVPQSPLPTQGISRRTLLKGAAVAAGGMTLAAAGAGAVGLGNIGGLGGGEARALTGKCLVLYDGEGIYGWIGDVHAKLLTNLLGRFLPGGSGTNSHVRKTISQYQAGDTERYDATFYLGSVFDNKLPEAFKTDVMKTTKPLCWFKYNIHQLAWGAGETAFRQRFGLALYGNVQWGADYNTVMYKGRQVLRNGIDPELSWMDPIDPAKASAVATIYPPADPGRWPIPYITRSGNFWYVADVPFSYISEEDRYMVFADVLFDILGVQYAPTKRALVRIEDVNPESDPADLKRVADYLGGAGVPFSISLIPVYKDPLGIFNDGKPVSTNLSAAKDVISALKYMVSKGGEIVMHGTTHQHGTDANPYNAVSGDDYEFFRVTENADHTLTYVGPITGDSSSWCSGLLNEGKRELQKAGFTPFAFEAPHYAASDVDFKAMASMFGRTYHRALYFQERPVTTKAGTGGGGGGTSLKTKSRTLAPAAAPMGVSAGTTQVPLNFGGQFFPYVIARDIYNQKVIPENLGNIEPLRWPDPVLGPYPTRFAADLIRSAGRNLVVRDAFASFFFHPFWDLKYLSDSVEGIKGLGYSFVKASSL